MNLKISLGGDVVQYLGAIGLLKALDEAGLNDIEIHCSGFSCIPTLLWFYNKNSAYNVISKMWEETLKTFPNASKPSLKELSKSLLVLLKMQKRLDPSASKEKILQFVDKWIPEQKLEDIANLRIYAYNLTESKEEILSGNSKEAIAKAIAYPIDFSPVDSYISLSWVVGIPDGDVIIYLDWDKDIQPQKATDYLLISTFARSFELTKQKKSKAKFCSEINLKSFADISSISKRFYDSGRQLVSLVTQK
uniref:PNPLA domain-containing protein n=1 Tax=Fervidobacterium nodosum TaxID=2424 RepID=A0A7C5Y9P9_9BACT